VIRGLVRWFDERLGASRFARTALDKAFPDHWSFMLGEIALYAFVVLVASGTFLAFFFEPSLKTVTYHGGYAPLRGVQMSAAYASVVNLSFDVRAGLVMRQTHHWAALVFIAAIVAHLCRIFFTGAFRRPREVNWIIGVTMLLLAIANGFTGYSLPDDLLSGTGLRIAYSIVLSVPVVGTWLAFLLFGGEFPASSIVSRLFVIHIFLVPVALFALITAHLAILWRQKHTQFSGPKRTERNVVGSRLWPKYAVKSLGLFALVAGVLAGLGGLAQINPVWLYGPFDPAAVSTAAQPDWYVGWLEGALRLAPPWYLHIGPYNVPEVFWPGVVLPGLTFVLLYAWPFMEARLMHDYAEHHLLDRPRDRPVRSAIGVGVLSFYIVLLFAGGQDLIATTLESPIEPLTQALRIALVVVPLVAALFTYKFCRDLAAGGELEEHREAHREPRTPRAPAAAVAGGGGAGASLTSWARDTAGALAGAAVLSTLAAFGRRRRA
jgi:ubiquinol-cytochrome c reductase cytochrome b subunit